MSRLALIAGTGALPAALVSRLVARGEVPLVCEMRGFPSEVPADLPRQGFRVERLGSFLDGLPGQGVGRVCMVGAMRRPGIDPAEIDPATAPLVPRIAAAMERGDDGLLREVVALFEERGIAVVGAADLAPDLLPAPGVPTRAEPGGRRVEDARAGEAELTEMARIDEGQACVVRDGRVMAREDRAGTDALLAGLVGGEAAGGLLFKAPKPGQERRVDLPVIGAETVAGAAAAGLSGLVIEAGGVMVVDLADVVARLDAAGMFLWVRPRGGA